MTVSSFTLVTGDFVPTGGMDQANYALARHLAQEGHPLTLVSHRVASDLVNLPQVRFRRTWKPLRSYFLGQWPLAWVGRRAAQDETQVGGRTVVNGGNCCFPDVNWVHYVHAAYRPILHGSWGSRVKAWIDYRLNVRSERRALECARVVICNSDLTRRHVVDFCRVDPTKAVTVYYGTDPAKYRPATTPERNQLRAELRWPTDRPIVMFVGALGDRRKGFDSLFAAWVQLCKAGEWDPLLMVVGSGRELSAWQTRAADAGLADRVQFLGFRDDVPTLLRAADALVAPTRYEAYGLGVQEALCCGLPAFVSATAGVAERYPTELADFLLSNPEDTAELATRLARWRHDPAAARERIRPLSERLSTYTWDDMSRRILEVIDQRIG